MRRLSLVHAALLGISLAAAGCGTARPLVADPQAPASTSNPYTTQQRRYPIGGCNDPYAGRYDPNGMFHPRQVGCPRTHIPTDPGRCSDPYAGRYDPDGIYHPREIGCR